MTPEDLKKMFVARTNDDYFISIASEFRIKHPRYRMPNEPHFMVWLGLEIATDSQYLDPMQDYK